MAFSFYRVWIGLVVALACVGAARLPAQAPALQEDKQLDQELQSIAAAHHGRVAVYAHNLRSGETASLAADEAVKTASVIKMGILLDAAEQIRAGKASLQEKLVLTHENQVQGSGVLGQLTAPLALTLGDTLHLMVVVSDNTATNLAIDRIGLDAVNARIAWMGLKDTHLYKKIGKPSEGPMPADQPKYGLGKSTPQEMATVMERIGRCQLDTPVAVAAPLTEKDTAICGVAMKMLRNQFYRDTIPRYLEKLDSTETGSGTASKTGSLNAARADVAIVAGKSGPMVLSIFTYDNVDMGWTADNEGELTIARLARAIVEAWSPAGIDGKTLVPGLGLAPVGPPTSSRNGPAASN